MSAYRGKVSEGLDFSDRAGRAVVITGIPYAMKTDPKVGHEVHLRDVSPAQSSPETRRLCSTSIHD